MAYDVLGESLELINNGLPERSVRLSRRRRFAAVAVDVDRDIAATRFVRRGVGCFWDETHLLEHEGATWRMVGGGGSSTAERWSTEEFELERHRLPAARVDALSGSSVLRGSDRLLPWGARWIRSAQVLAGPAVAAIIVDGRRRLAVPPHGHLVVVWGSRHPPRVSACDVAGRILAEVALPKDR